jgi:hypothetical protein
MKTIVIIIQIALFSSLSSCYGVNSKTSEIGDLDDTCLEEGAWDKLTENYAVDSTTPKEFASAVYSVKGHFIHPKYVLFFKEEPMEVVGCDYYSVRAVYNPKLSKDVLHGLSPKLSDDEQVRIRNRVQKALMEYQCDKGKKKSQELFKRPAVYSEEYYDL